MTIIKSLHKGSGDRRCHSVISYESYLTLLTLSGSQFRRKTFSLLFHQVNHHSLSGCTPLTPFAFLCHMQGNCSLEKTWQVIKTTLKCTASDGKQIIIIIKKNSNGSNNNNNNNNNNNIFLIIIIIIIIIITLCKCRMYLCICANLGHCKKVTEYLK